MDKGGSLPFFAHAAKVRSPLFVLMARRDAAQTNSFCSPRRDQSCRRRTYHPCLPFHPVFKERRILAQIVTYARPSRLFRYRRIDKETIDRELKAIEESYIFCAGHTTLNDPMEGGHRLSTMLSKGRSSQAVKVKVEQAVGSMGIASFSEIKNHETMWAHYANNFKGICISYKTMSLISGLASDIDIVKMNYSEDPPVLLRNSETPEERAKLSLSYKTLRWSQEREWRVFSINQGKQRYRNISTVSAVYIGARVENEERKTIIRRIRAIKIPVYKMRIDSYQLKFSNVV